jgi:hypothetical protein
MTLPLGQRTLRERSAPHSLVDRKFESKGFRHGVGKKPLTVRARRVVQAITAALHVVRGCNAGQSSWIVTEVIATGSFGRSRALRGALTILSTTSMPFVTWPKIV